MFRESLLDSSPSRHDRKRWPMATAFVLESIIAGLIIITPLLSTGVIPVSARVPRIAPLQAVSVASEPPRVTSGQNSGMHSPTATVVTISQIPNSLPFGPARNADESPNTGPSIPVLRGDPGPNLPICINCQPVVTPPVHSKPLRISQLSTAQLVHRVEPLYPRTAVLINLQGDVKLHAIIARDGTIQSLSVTSGHPMLAQAALDAVRQWRYRPYLLNGEAVEVETFITVTFRRDHSDNGLKP
jgi:periplasmic protein TonB